MRDLARLVLFLSLMMPAIPVMAGTGADYRDDFGDGNYSGNDGSLVFAGPWSEFGDSGGAGSGAVHVGSENCSNNECLHIEGDGLVAATYGVIRPADLSMFEQVTLSFDVQVVPKGMTTTELAVEVSSGSKWTLVKTFDLAAAGSHHKEIDVTAHAGKGSAVRFRVLDVLGGAVLGLDLFYTGYATVDRVTLSGTLKPSPTTTTSTTAPTTTSTTTRPTTTTSSPTQTTTSTRGSTATTTDAGANTPLRASAQTSGPTNTMPGSIDTSGEGDVAGAALTGPLPPDGPSSPPPATGLRVTAGGVIADYKQGMMGDMDMTGVEVLGVDVTADFSMAVELFETARVWIAGLALVIAAAIIGGIDRKRNRD